MRTDPPVVVPYSNLSLAWGWALRRSVGRPSPLIVSITEFEDGEPVEESSIRAALDDVLRGNDKTVTTEDNASMIFPRTSWALAGGDEERFYERYINKEYPRLRARGGITYGSYFHRMIAYDGEKKGKIERCNQLQHIIDRWRYRRAQNKRPRESELQIALFDPAKDHSGQPVRGFPCLQQISITYDNQGGMALTALYPTQYLFERAYGNYLGLSRLGFYLANAMELEFVRLTCVIAAPSRGAVRVRDMAPVLAVVNDALAAHAPGAADEG